MIKGEIEKIIPEVYKKIVEHVNVAISVHEYKNYVRTIYVNKRFEELSGYTLEEYQKLGSEAARMTLHPDDHDVTREIQEFITKGENDYFNGIHRYRKKNGEWIWVYAAISILERAKDGTPVKIISAAFDITSKIDTIPQVEKLLKENLNLKNSIQLNKLTKRQIEILSHISKGKNDKEISDVLFISPLTVKTHRANMCKRLEIKNSTALFRFAVDCGFL